MLRSLYGAIAAIIILCCPISRTCAQENIPLDNALSFSDRLLQQTRSKLGNLQATISRQSQRRLQQLAASEARMRKKLCAVDSAGAVRLFGNSQSPYDSLLRQLKDTAAGTPAGQGTYLPYLDSLKGSLSFLQQHADKLSGAQQLKLAASLRSVQQLEDKLQYSAQVKTFIRGRQQQVMDYFAANSGLAGSFTKELGNYRQQYYYYAQQLRDYREMWKDPDRCQRKALTLLNKVPAFQEFMKEHGQLACLFRLPADYGTPASLGGLQTRNEVQERIQSFVAAGGPGAEQLMQQNLQAAKGELNKMKDKLNLPGGEEGDEPIPGFKPNNQRTKTFLQRLEYGANLQTARSSSLFPTTTDIGLSIGYRLNDKSVAGVGASYKFGWGHDISHIAFSNQGAGLRSFLDYKLKGSFYASGGLEYNYQQPFDGLADINALDKWQQSGLIGLSKIVSMKSRFFKQTSLQLLWDFLSYYQAPRAQPLKFRLGYKF